MILVAAILAAALSATPDEAEVLAAVQSFFDSMTTKDVAAAEQVLAPEGRFFSVRVIDGKKVVRSSTNREYLDGLAEAKDDWLERMWNPEVKIHGDLATVWAPYDFHVNGQFSHCGVDAFNLMRIDGLWKITGGSYTVEREECLSSPLGPVK